MCVICYIPKGTKLPNKERIKAMWDSNSDGGGLFWIANGQVHISKGYFNFESFYKDILTVKDFDYELAIHMRIATAGGISQNMCHPFPISNKKEDIFDLDGAYDSAIMHNGIIPIRNRAEYSDTAEFIVTNLYSRYLNDRRFYKHFSDKSRRKLENAIGGSRMLFFGGDGSIEMVGSWSEKDGCYYSNLNFEWRENRYNSYGYGYNNYSYGRYGYYDYYADDDDDEIISFVNSRQKKKENKKKDTYKSYKEYCVDKYGFYPFD